MVGETFRESMGWLHTWGGVVLGTLLFAVFWTGTLSVFDKEIDRWMMPETRLAVTEQPSWPPLLNTARKLAPDAPFWSFFLPSKRVPVVRIFYRNSAGDFTFRDIEPQTGALLPDAGTLAGTRFIFPFHYSLHLRWMDLGYWLVGLAGMGTLVLLVSGVVIHRKIFKDFFTFRPDRKLPRSSLDLHNLTGVLALPFHFIMALSGLIIFMAIYFPTVVSAPYDGDRVTFFKEAFGVYRTNASGEPASQGLAPLADMVAEASRRWNSERPQFIRVWHPSDAEAYVEVRRSVERSISYKLDAVYFDGTTGAVLHEHASGPVVRAQRFIAGLHFIQFEHWTLRWLYFVLGLAGCVMIATGYIYWLEARRKHHAAQGLAGVRVVEGLTVGAVTGLIIATLSFFLVNRLLPLDTSFAGYDRATLEVWTFYLAWLVTFTHAWVWPRRAWREQCWAIAGLAILAVILNAATTGDHLVRSLAHRHLWPVAGMDLLLLAGAAIALLTALRLARRGIAAGPAQDMLKAAE